MSRKIDLSGKVFERWTALKRGKPGYWFCRCSCGTVRDVFGPSLSKGVSRSCGCLKAEVTAKRNFRHGLYRTPGYNSWANMKRRCEDEKSQDFHLYGGRGIRICRRWRKSFLNFIHDMGPKPSRSHSIERIDVNGNYTPKNCKWATPKEQGRNRRDNRKITYNGHTLILMDWARLLGLSGATIQRRLSKGWSPKEALTLHRFCNSGSKRVIGKCRIKEDTRR